MILSAICHRYLYLVTTGRIVGVNILLHFSFSFVKYEMKREKCVDSLVFLFLTLSSFQERALEPPG